MATLLESALNYAARGWAVLPLHSSIDGKCDCGRSLCSSPAKHPRTLNGLKDATKDAEIIKSWWRQWPTSNIGVTTGKNSGIFVLDVDGEEGRKFLDGKHIPMTVVSQTGKGFHYVFLHPGRLIKNAVRIAPELDIRGDGGYIVAPPSIHASGNQYTWAEGMTPEEVALAEGPTWILDLIVSNKNGSQQAERKEGRISEGKRNDHLTSLAGGMRRRGMAENSILAALIEENRAKCDPLLDEEEVQRIAHSVAAYEPEPGKEKEDNQATKLIKIADGLEFFHSGDRCFATIPVGNHFETWPINTQGFRRWINHCFFEQEGKAARTGAVQEAIETLNGKAQFQGPEKKVFRRMAFVDGKTYVDLANDDWQAVEIDDTGWRVVSNPPVKFLRSRGMLPLPMPQDGGSLQDLRPFVNIGDRDWPLLLGWIIGACRTKGPYPVLVLQGEQGTAKSTLAREVRDLIDPNISPLRSEPREARELMISANNGWILAFDNLSHLQPWFSDALCRLSTGGGFSTRELYTDEDEKLFDAERPIVLNGIEDLAIRGDLVERAIVLHLPVIAENQRQPVDLLRQGFEVARPRIFGGLLTAISCAIKNEARTKLDGYPRMADFARWVTAAEPAMEWEHGFFVKAYSGNREDANETTLNASSLTAPLLEFLQVGLWEGTASELLTRLNDITDESVRKNPKLWPANGARLSNMLRRLAPNLRVVGLDVVFDRTPGRRIIKLEKREKVASLSSSASLPPLFKDGNDDHDAYDASSPICSESETTEIL